MSTGTRLRAAVEDVMPSLLEMKDDFLVFVASEKQRVNEEVEFLEAVLAEEDIDSVDTNPTVLAILENIYGTDESDVVSDQWISE